MVREKSGEEGEISPVKPGVSNPPLCLSLLIWRQHKGHQDSFRVIACDPLYGCLLDFGNYKEWRKL